VAVGRLTAPCGRCLGDRRVDLDLLPAHIGSRGAEGLRVGHGPGEGKSEGPSRLDGGDEPEGNRATAFVAGGVDEGHRPLDPLEHRYVAGPPANNIATRGFGSEKSQRRSRGAATVLLWVA